MTEKKIEKIFPQNIKDCFCKNNIRFSLLRKHNIMIINLYHINISFDLIFSKDLKNCSIKNYSNISNFHENHNEKLSLIFNFYSFLNENIQKITEILRTELIDLELASKSKFYKFNSVEYKDDFVNANNFHFEVINEIKTEESCTNRTGKDNLFYSSLSSVFKILDIERFEETDRSIIQRGLNDIQLFKNESQYFYSPCKESTINTSKNINFFLSRRITSVYSRNHTKKDLADIFRQFQQKRENYVKNDYEDRFLSDEHLFYSVLIKTIFYLIIEEKNDINTNNLFFWQEIEILTDRYKYPSIDRNIFDTIFQNPKSIKDIDDFEKGVYSLINFYKEYIDEINNKTEKYINNFDLDNYIFNSYYDYEILIPKKIKNYFLK